MIRLFVSDKADTIFRSFPEPSCSEFGKEQSFSKSLIVLGCGFGRSIDIDSYI